MKAALLLRRRLVLDEAAFVELVVWQVPKRVRGSGHDFKYRLALIADGSCIMRYDNEAGKGDHKHIGSLEVPYRFESLTQLQADFWADVESWQEERECGPSR
jgi:hypothetical protein